VGTGSKASLIISLGTGLRSQIRCKHRQFYPRKGDTNNNILTPITTYLTPITTYLTPITTYLTVLE
jgi:hypothetical protein